MQPDSRINQAGSISKFYDDLKENLNSNGFELVWDDSMSKGWTSWSGFSVKFSKEQNFYLRFEFGYSGLHDLYWGIKRVNDLIKKDDAIWNKINEMMNDQFGFGRKTEGWPWWSWIDKKEFNNAYRNWDSNETPWISIKEKRLSEKITDLAIRVRNAFNKNQNLKLLSGEVSPDIGDSSN